MDQALNVYLPQPMYDWLKAKAIEERRTLRATLELLIEDAMREDDAA
ncbi:MAG TPA: hypothetical protein VLE97_00090 [Gaiellaceae bacterium]|nr:hypothetical protein [Gaiellaceae bacterium]